MSSSTAPIPESKRFFRLSELAGKRWPSVTEDDIFEWHDTDITLREGRLVVFDFWVFFPELRVMPLNREEPRGDLQRQHDALVPYDLLINVYLRPDRECVKGFAHNGPGKVNCLLLFDESEKMHVPADFSQDAQKCFVCQVEISKNDLLLNRLSVLFLEEIMPDITSAGFLGRAPVSNEKQVGTKEDRPTVPPVGKPLIGWKEIADYTGQSVSTAQRKYTPVVRYDGKRVIAYREDIDAHLYKMTEPRKKRKR